ncbi:IS30 family transposase [Streptomyces albidoflavus]|uniref:IS30 family transposase n=1 Tax=Streptomyces fungicidicus TaxID=68203 RepID=A0ACC7Y8W0_9ACTN|nr:IS30 family transposase [Streptomyces fungicidicus]PAX85180.1 IS30 family transposase [Streptomyces albidoflavus]PAX89484.1 IS30 family transposase [Streptomyces albidoflavus]PBO20162.1 IS30 family transposase [Streptomyces albidoflavus]PBO24324.1 IS30 family transposase [Streptomyces albidoflavus]
MRDYGFSPAQQDEIWRRWREGQSFSLIGRALGAPMQSARRFLYQSGGVRLAPQTRSERHLSGSEREEISRGIAAGESARQLAKRLGRSPSTVSREIARNGGRDRYRAAPADATAYARGRRPKQAKLAQRPVLRTLVEAKLVLCWSPEQIAGWLRRQFPGDASMQISHEAIYLSLYDPRRRQAIDRSLTQRLRSGRPMRRPKLARRPTGRGIIRGMVSITARPAEVEDRKVPGHWEGDLVMGTRPSAVATLVERTSRYTTVVALPDGIKAEQVTPHLTRSLLGIPTQLRRTLTWDRGREIAEHQAITAETGMPIYLCKPRSPWQRGTNENTNRLLRQYLPKGADLRTFSQADLDAIAHELNHRPRKTHGYRTPAEVYADLLNSSDALTA